jgi:hypothetical protein
MKLRNQLSLVALSLLVLGSVSPSISAQAAPQEAINANQLKTLLNETKAVKADKVETNRMLQARFKQLPDWFPSTLKSLISGQISSVNPVKFDLPIYQKYISKTQADQLILFFQGPAGDAVAAHLPPQAAQPASPAELAPLITARLSQLDAQQQAAIGETVAAYQAALPKIRTDQGTAFDLAFDNAKATVISQHEAEYSSAASGNSNPGSSLAH